MNFENMEDTSSPSNIGEEMLGNELLDVDDIVMVNKSSFVNRMNDEGNTRGKQARTAADISSHSLSNKQHHIWSQKAPISNQSSSGANSSKNLSKQVRNGMEIGGGGKKKRDSNRVKKLMSCLEGDSLLREIERSLE